MDAKLVRAVVREELLALADEVQSKNRFGQHAAISPQDLRRFAATPTPATPAPPAGGQPPWWHFHPEDGDDAIHWIDNATQELDLFTTALAAERAEVGRLREYSELLVSANRGLGETIAATAAQRDEARAESDRLRAEIEKLSDPVAVHVNMLRGSIAKPSITNIVHLYGAEALAQELTPAPAADGMRMGGLLPGLRHALKWAETSSAAVVGETWLRTEITAAEQRGDATPPSADGKGGGL